MKVIWVNGLPGSGKTTFSRNLYRFLVNQNKAVVLLDGDDLRRAFNNRFGYTKQERINLAHIYINLAKLLAEQNSIVIISTVSLFNEVYKRLMQEIPTAKIVFINARTDLLDIRNQKSLRTIGAIDSPGISFEVDFPQDPFLTLRGDETEAEMFSIFENLSDEIK
jgi:adenylylsulfate kinase-like enzyme